MKGLRMHKEETDGGFQLERNTLRFLCSVLIKRGTRAEICNLLDAGVFEDPLQRVVFEEIRDLGSISSRRLRQLLPSAATLGGTCGGLRQPLGHPGSCFPFGWSPALCCTGTLQERLDGGRIICGMPPNARQCCSDLLLLDFASWGPFLVVCTGRSTIT